MKILFRVDASYEIGLGHLMRCINLAEEGDLFICKKIDENVEGLILKNKFNLLKISEEDNEIEFIIKSINKYKCDIVVIDSYEMYDIISYLKEENIFVACFDDLGLTNINANVIINHNPFADINMYNNLIEKNIIIAGYKYTLINKSLNKLHGRFILREKIEKILVTLGGSKLGVEIGDKIIEKFINTDFKVTFLIGRMDLNIDFIKKKYEKFNNINVIEFTENLGELMLANDFIICAGGTTLWEVMYLGIPFGVIEIVENQKKSVDFVKKNNIGLILGRKNDINYNLIEKIKNFTYDDRKRQSLICQKIIDGKGYIRIREYLENIKSNIIKS